MANYALKGRRVALKKSALSVSYIAARTDYTNMYEGKQGTILYQCSSGKLAIQFDDIVFTRPHGIVSSHDKQSPYSGQIQFSWYVPEEHVEFIEDNNPLFILLV